MKKHHPPEQKDIQEEEPSAPRNAALIGLLLLWLGGTAFLLWNLDVAIKSPTWLCVTRC